MTAENRRAGRDGEHVAGVDVDRPNVARMYDYYLGGDSHFAADRAAAEQHLAQVPQTRDWARANRAFLGRAVRYLLAQGIDQFLDLGSGIPTVGNVHQIAQKINPAARVAYVDFEPVAVTHARQLLDDNPLVTVTQADIRDSERVLAAPGVTGLLDFRRPVGLLAVSIVHMVLDDQNPWGLVARYRDACVPGSYLAMSHLAPVALTEEQIRHGYEVYSRTTTPGVLRSAEEIHALMAGYELVEPGLVLLNAWRPEPGHELAAPVHGYCAVGYLP